MSAHQAWLEAPYDQAARLEAAFEYWCEDNGRDVDDEEAFEEFERYCDDWLD
jgi:elongation factor P hydroxylase